MANPLGGQGSGDFRETSGRVQLFHMGTRNSVGVLTADAFTQANPPIVTAGANVSSTLAGISKKGVLGSTVAFTRPDAGNGFHGGPVLVTAAYQTGQKPLGIFINDSLGNPFENTPGVASGRGPYVCGMATVGLSLYETRHQKTGSAAITYAVGDKVYAGVNGLVTNVIEDGYEDNASAGTNTVLGIVKVAPDANNSLLVIDLRV
jgi:hypothetical protein